MPTTTHQPRRIMRLPQVQDATGFGRAWIYELMKRGDFPQAHKIGLRAVGWVEADIDAWVSARMEAAGVR